MKNTMHQTRISNQESVFANPKTYFFFAALVSFGLSVSLWFGGQKDLGIFVGLWVPSICSAGTLLLSRREA